MRFTFFLALALLASSALCGIGYGCAMIGDNGYYDLTGLSAQPNKDGKKYYQLGLEYQINLCTPVIPTCTKPKGDTDYFVTMIGGGTTCKALIRQNATIKISEIGGISY